MAIDIILVAVFGVFGRLVDRSAIFILVVGALALGGLIGVVALSAGINL
jgi:hypothetical protein